MAFKEFLDPKLCRQAFSVILNGFWMILLQRNLVFIIQPLFTREWIRIIFKLNRTTWNLPREKFARTETVYIMKTFILYELHPSKIFSKHTVYTTRTGKRIKIYPHSWEFIWAKAFTLTFIKIKISLGKTLSTLFSVLVFIQISSLQLQLLRMASTRNTRIPIGFDRFPQFTCINPPRVNGVSVYMKCNSFGRIWDQLQGVSIKYTLFKCLSLQSQEHWYRFVLFHTNSQTCKCYLMSHDGFHCLQAG